MISACISVKLGLQPYSKGVFECDLTAGKTATQARMGEHNFFSKKENVSGVERHAQSKELLLNLLKTPSLSGDGFNSARVVDEMSAVLKQP